MQSLHSRWSKWINRSTTSNGFTNIGFPGILDRKLCSDWWFNFTITWHNWKIIGQESTMVTSHKTLHHLHKIYSTTWSSYWKHVQPRCTRIEPPSQRSWFCESFQTGNQTIQSRLSSLWEEWSKEERKEKGKKEGKERIQEGAKNVQKDRTLTILMKVLSDSKIWCIEKVA